MAKRRGKTQTKSQVKPQGKASQTPKQWWQQLPVKSTGKGAARRSRLCDHYTLECVFERDDEAHLFAVAQASIEDVDDLLDMGYARVFVIGPAEVVIRRTNYRLREEIEEAKEVISKHPVVADLAEFVGEEQREYPPEAALLPLPWPDYAAPKAMTKFWIELSNKLERGDAVLATCMGAHGRTGTTLAILGYLLGYLDPGEHQTAMDVVVSLREAYCPSAVESESQLQYIATVLGLDTGTWIPRKSPYVSYAGDPYGGRVGGGAYGTYATKGGKVSGAAATPTGKSPSKGSTKRDILNDPFYYSDRLPLDDEEWPL